MTLLAPELSSGVMPWPHVLLGITPATGCSQMRLLWGAGTQ